MKKIYSFITLFMMVFMLTFAPTQKAEAGACDTVCLLQMGGAQVQNLGTQLKAILSTIQKTIMGWLEDAKAWLDKYAQKAWSFLDLDEMDKVKIPESNVPSLAGKETGIAAGKSYQISGSNPVGDTMTSEEAAAAIKDQTVNSGTAAAATGKVDEIATAKQDELLSASGSFSSAQYEGEKKQYISQQEAVDSLAKALVAKNLFSDLEKKGTEMDELFAAIQGSSVAKPEATMGEKIAQGIDGGLTIAGGIVDAITHPINTITGKKDYIGEAIDAAINHDLHTAIKNNLQVRFMLDKLLLLKQQLLAFRLKNAATRGMNEMEPVARVSPIEIIVPQSLPAPTDKVKTPGK